MAKISNREKILTEGLKVVHERGFSNASVRDIVQAAGVPQGSFTNHFASKEAFGLEIIDLYLARARETMRATLLNDERDPFERLGAYIDASKNRIIANDMRNGCLFGNFTADSCETSEIIREKLGAVFAEIRQSLTYCLQAAIAAGKLPADHDCDETAAFVLSSVQGAILLSKAERGVAPIERCKKLLFAKILR